MLDYGLFVKGYTKN